MTIVTNTTNRKALAKAIGEELGIPAKYTGVPYCNYQIGSYILDKEGVLHGEDFEALRSFLQRNGMLPEEGIPLSQARENAGEQLTAAETEEAPANTEPEKAHPEEDAPDVVTVSVPADQLTPLQLKNLIFMLYSKQYLIWKMTGGNILNIPDSLVARLIESTPERMEDYIPLLDYAREKGMTGFDFKEDKVSMSFAVLPDEPDRNHVYAMLAARIVKAAREATRIVPEKMEPENEKYFARAWLLRIGYGGAGCKEERNLLLKRLKGHSAFPNDEAAEKHKMKYAEIRKEKKTERGEEKRHE